MNFAHFRLANAPFHALNATHRSDALTLIRAKKSRKQALIRMVAVPASPMISFLIISLDVVTADAQEKMETWLRHYNTKRPHVVIGYKTPGELVNPGPASGPSPG